MNNTSRSMIRNGASALLAAGISLGAMAQSTGMDSPEARFKQERAACLNGSSHQDRATCLKEATNALDEARRNKGSSRSGEELLSNRLARCERVPARDREACQRLAMGQGQQSGSVEGGGVIKEITKITIGPPVVIVPAPR
jgi:hypothetical protein